MPFQHCWVFYSPSSSLEQEGVLSQLSSFYPVCFGEYLGQAVFTPSSYHFSMKQTEIAKTSTRNPVDDDQKVKSS